MNLAVFAAFTAAGLSLINVALSARLSSRGARDQWRREQEQPLIAKILNLSTDAVTAWHDTASLKPKLLEAANAGADDEKTRLLLDEFRGHWSKGQDLYLTMRDDAAQLDLLASRAVRTAAWRLLAEHELARRNLLPENPGASFTLREIGVIDRWHRRLISATRQDFGLDTTAHIVWRSLRSPARGTHKPIAKKGGPNTTQPAARDEHGEKLDAAASSKEPA
jgi:hypothetical protein